MRVHTLCKTMEINYAYRSILTYFSRRRHLFNLVQTLHEVIVA